MNPKTRKADLNVIRRKKDLLYLDKNKFCRIFQTH